MDTMISIATIWLTLIVIALAVWVLVLGRRGN